MSNKFSVNNIEAYAESKGIAPFILHVSIRCRLGVNFHPSHFTSGREPQYLFSRVLYGLQGLSGHFGEKKNLFPPPAFEPQTIQPVA